MSLIKLQLDQAKRVLEACGWSIETINDPDGKDGVAYSCKSPDGFSQTKYYATVESALFFALAARIGNGHWQPNKG